MLATFVIGLTATPAFAAVTCTISGSGSNHTLTVALQTNDSVALTVAGLLALITERHAGTDRSV